MCRSKGQGMKDRGPDQTGLHHRAQENRNTEKILCDKIMY